MQVKGQGCRLCKQLEDRLAVVFIPNNMTNGECTVVLLRSKHSVFSNMRLQK